MAKKPARAVKAKKNTKAATTKKTAKAAAEKKPVTPEEQEKLWEKAMEKGKGRDVPYNMTGRFKASNIILHETFGRGIVVAVCPNKMTISFRDKERILVSSNQ